jgi:hypothetical protein
MTHVSAQNDSATQQVFDHHLGAFAQGLDELLKDYDDGSTIITPDKTYSTTVLKNKALFAYLQAACEECDGNLNGTVRGIRVADCADAGACRSG